MNEYMNSAVLHIACIMILGVVVMMNRAALIDPKWPLLGIGLGMAVWLLFGVYTLLIALWSFYQTGGLPTLAAVLAGIGVIPVVCVAAFVIKVQQYPKIHDITTDTHNPPLLHHASQIRHASHNSTHYRSENAGLQKKGYPTLKPLLLDVSPQQAFTHVLAVVQRMGWGIYSVDEAQGRIEAYDKTAWLGFIDDIAVRVSEHQEGSRIDVRSASRIGVSDLGANAQRIEVFMHQLSSQEGVSESL